LSNPSSDNGVALALTSASGYFSFDSKESLFTSHEAELEIALNGGGEGSGTVTSVGSGLGLTGGPITTAGTLSIDPTVVPQLGAANNMFIGNITALSFSGNGTGLTNVNAATLSGAPAGTFPSLTTSNNFVGNQTITGNLTLNGVGSTLTVGGPSFFNMDVPAGAAVTSNCLASAGASCTGFQFNGLSGNTILNAQINNTTELTVDAGGDMTLKGALVTRDLPGPDWRHDHWRFEPAHHRPQYQQPAICLRLALKPEHISRVCGELHDNREPEHRHRLSGAQLPHDRHAKYGRWLSGTHCRHLGELQHRHWLSVACCQHNR
jgi:hypothetical protein